MIKPIIVIPAYNRPDSLARLLNSISNAEFPKSVKLLISLEGGAHKDVKKIAYEFSSSILDVNIVQHEERLGLRDHILACGDFALEFGAVIVLEDDLLVDRFFYSYTMAAIEYYSHDLSVAGIALYAPEYHDYIGVPFRPMANGYSTYSMQIPCSSGQCWTAGQWKSFRDWYRNYDGEALGKSIGLPRQVKNWSQNSWKKYFAAYILQQNLNFIYPYQSYTTNCSDVGGEHIPFGSDVYQVSFACQSRLTPSFSFCPVERAEVVYDVFMEPCGSTIFQLLKVKKSDIEIDFGGNKPLELLSRKKYVLTCRPVKKFIRQYPRCYRPIEHNLLYPLQSHETGALFFSNSSDIESIDKYKQSLAEYSYFSGLNVGSRKVLKEIVRNLPNLTKQHIRNLMRLK